MAAFGDRGRYRHSARHPPAVIPGEHARPSQHARGRQAPARDPEPHDGAEGRQAVPRLSTPGGDNQDQALLQVLLNIIDFGMTPQAAVEAPRFQSEHFYASFANHEFIPGKLNVENRIPRETIEALNALGHKVTVSGPWSNASAPVVIQMGGGVLTGAADPRRGRFVFGR